MGEGGEGKGRVDEMEWSVNFQNAVAPLNFGTDAAMCQECHTVPRRVEG